MENEKSGKDESLQPVSRAEDRQRETTRLIVGAIEVANGQTSLGPRMGDSRGMTAKEQQATYHGALADARESLVPQEIKDQRAQDAVDTQRHSVVSQSPVWH